MTLLKGGTAVFLFLVMSSAYAHTAHGIFGEEMGFVYGFKHPVLGLDHFLAMLSVGILSAQRGERAMWLYPTIFVSVMLLGGVIGFYGTELPYLEFVIAASVVVLGFAIAAEVYVRHIVIGIAIAFFAIYHGNAHGIEIPSNFETPLYYSLGFMTGTTLIHILGLTVAFVPKRLTNSGILLRYSGAVMAGMGIHILIM